MIIAQITDLHVVAKDRLCYRRVPTNDHLAQSIAHINGLDPIPDAVIASGDLTDHGRPEEYDLLREILSGLIPPVFVIPGNHDRRDVLLKAFAGEDYMPPPDAPFVNYAIDRYPVRLVGLDTSVPGHHHGMMCEDRLRWLDDTLGARPWLGFRPCCIVVLYADMTRARPVVSFGQFAVSMSPSAEEN